MYAANSILAARGGCSALSNGCRGVTSRSASSSHASNRRNNNNGVLAAASSAGAACAMCHSVRLTAACSASTTALHLRHIHAASQDMGAARRSISSSNNLYGGNQTHFGNGMDPSALAWNVARDGLKSSNNGTLGNNYSALHIRTVSSSSQVMNDAFGGLMGSYAGGLTAAAVSSQDALLDGSAAAGGAASSGWKLQELAGAILFAGVATAGSMLLGPIEGLGGKTSGSGGGGGGGGGGDPGGGGGGGPPVSGKYENAFESPAKEKENQEPQVAVGIASLPKPYEVSVRALRGGRLSMEDEFVVVSGGRLSAVFDGHGGGGVSQYLRDRLHVIITEQLDHQATLQKSNRKFRGDLKRMFGMGRKTAQAQGDENTEDAESKPRRYDLSNIGNLPVSAVAAALKESFDQVDKEILLNDEYEYQGSTAVATLLHEASDGTRTLLSANIGDSRGVLSRNGRAIDLTRDHKPNDDKEKARILAMGEKIEWDHYCKVHRVRNLSLSRAIGDRFAKPAVSGEVEIKRFPVYDDKDEFILLASDGLWDVMSSQEVVSYVHKRLNAPPKDGADITCEEDMASLKYLRRKNMSRFIANEALRRGSGDNISVVMVWLKEPAEIHP